MQLPPMQVQIAHSSEGYTHPLNTAHHTHFTSTTTTGKSWSWNSDRKPRRDARSLAKKGARRCWIVPLLLLLLNTTSSSFFIGCPCIVVYSSSRLRFTSNVHQHTGFQVCIGGRRVREMCTSPSVLESLFCVRDHYTREFNSFFSLAR